jgi:hypothetical protein
MDALLLFGMLFGEWESEASSFGYLQEAEKINCSVILFWGSRIGAWDFGCLHGARTSNSSARTKGVGFLQKAKAINGAAGSLKDESDKVLVVCRARKQAVVQCAL